MIDKKEKIDLKEEKKTEKVDREIYWVLGVMLGLIIIFLAANSFFQSLKTFEYEGLSFSKEKFGDIPVFHYYYYTFPRSITGSVTNEQPKQINIYLRNDPRENPVQINEEIEFQPKNHPIYISTNVTGLEECKPSVGISTLSAFLSQNGHKLIGAIPDMEQAINEDIRYANCGSSSGSNVILIQKGEETKITRNEDCYIIDVNQCEIIPAVEKFIVQTIIDAKARQ